MSGIHASHPSGRRFATFGFAILQIRRTREAFSVSFLSSSFKTDGKSHLF